MLPRAPFFFFFGWTVSSSRQNSICRGQHKRVEPQKMPEDITMTTETLLFFVVMKERPSSRLFEERSSSLTDQESFNFLENCVSAKAQSTFFCYSMWRTLSREVICIGTSWGSLASIEGQEKVLLLFENFSQAKWYLIQSSSIQNTTAILRAEYAVQRNPHSHGCVHLVAAVCFLGILSPLYPSSVKM